MLPFISVSSLVVLQMAQSGELAAAIAYSTLIRLFTRVNSPVNHKVSLFSKGFATLGMGAHEGPFPRLLLADSYMRSLVDFEAAHSGVAFSAHFASVRLSPGVGQLVALEMSLSDEGFPAVPVVAHKGPFPRLRLRCSTWVLMCVFRFPDSLNTFPQSPYGQMCCLLPLLSAK